jgi:uncharacterized membrane protein
MQATALPRVGHRPTATPRRTALAAVAALNAAAALGGAVSLVVGVIDLGPTISYRLPLHSPVLGGLALFVTVACPGALLAALAWRGDRRADAAAVVAGALLVGWIAVQLAFIRSFSWFQPAYAAVGLGLVAAGRHRAPRG